jgi:mono/diheme cytochrome c family protein
MMVPTLAAMLRSLLKPETRTRSARSVEYFGWLDLGLGCVIFIAPYLAASALRLPAVSILDANYLRVVGVLVAALGMLYVVSGRMNAEGFVVASLLDRPLVPAIMAVLWSTGVVPGEVAIAFSVSDFGGFLWTAFAWRTDILHGENIGGPGLQGQTRAARSIELFGWFSMAAGLVTLIAPRFIQSLLHLSAVSASGPNYFQLAGLLVGGLGMLYVLGGSLNANDFLLASLLTRLLTSIFIVALWWKVHLPTSLALVLSLANFGGFLWTLSAWRKDARLGGNSGRVPLIAKWVAGFFGFVSGVIRNARTFHPDGRTFLGTVESLHPPDPRFAAAADRLAGSVLMRIGMGVMKRGMPRWLADAIPDAPSIASRFFTASEPGEMRLQRRPGEDLDLLSTAGGDRLWKLLVNLATGASMYGLHKFDYFQNLYFADVPYRIDGGELDVWVRLAPVRDASFGTPQNGSERELELTNASARHAALCVEVQRAGTAAEPFVPIAEIRFEKEIEVDQEALHFNPVAGRGFEPHGFLTDLRKSVYPASAQSRSHSQAQRVYRERHIFGRLFNYFNEVPVGAVDDGRSITSAAASGDLSRGKCRWVAIALLAISAAVVISVLYLAERFNRDTPVDYANDVMFFERGSTGGEKVDGIPYWIWVALPEIFPEYLPDKKPGQGYSVFGMIYEAGDDPRYALPLGMSRRNVSGLDLVYLNCASCHTGTVRDAPGAQPRWVAGMPAHQFNLGAWGKFLTTIPKDQKFTPQRFLDQIDAMQNDSHHLVPKPDFIDRLIFRYYAVYLMRDKLLVLGQRLSFIDNSTWGPGRVDTFNAPKALLNFPMDKADPKELMGNCDFPSVWNQGPRKGMHLHWDGNNMSVDERNLSAAFGTGAYPPNLDTDRVLRMAKFLETAQPLAYPYAIDKALAARGKPVYEKYCTHCHGTPQPPFRRHELTENGCDYRGPDAECVGTVVPIEKIGTDPSRLNSYTWLLAVNQSTLYAGYEKDWGFNEPYPQRFHQFQKTHGYANMPLDGIWLRAPYLHNGSVPNLRELLEPSSTRTTVFYRGNDVFDPQNVGFVSNVATQGGQEFYRFETAQRGNGNQGHEGLEYGTELPPDEKRALLEYLKTF